MNVTKRRLIREVEEKVKSGAIQSGDTEAVINGLFEQISEHLNKGDKLALPECSVRSRQEPVRSRDHSSHSDSHGSKGLESRYFVVREFTQMFNDWRYFGKKTYQYIRKLMIVTTAVTIYYLFTVLIGC